MTRTIPNSLLASLTAGVLTATLGAPGVATAATRPRSATLCTSRPLPMPADVTHGEAWAIDPVGRFVAGRGLRVTGNGSEELLLLWDGPRVSVLPADPSRRVAAVNRYGVVVGSAFVDGAYRPWRYRGGRWEWLPVPATVSQAWPAGINARGDVVGHGSVEESESALPLLWPVDRPGTVEAVGGVATGAAQEIFDDGTIVGTSAGATTLTAWVRRPDGRIDPLTAPGTTRTWLRAAQGDWAVGGAGPAEDQAPIRWNLRTGAPLPVHPGLLAVRDVNARGAVLGDRAVDRDGRLVPLPGAVPGAVTVNAWAIADNGTIVGSLNGSTLRPVRWTGC
ncbi:hypothetical protein GA0074696_4019 [Micromonospora purpureochromogenes]|uniref:Extracellular repeat, HAF family n=1 Tax=Micromonospora purpureochromogenes TaxID=47872 RepID=A0A1C4Z423_9ACTN|nr:hypothetical protein [Micromonospora purpureochromogenes]SCF27769.1 hypothetical protein GA0074696_4019 [Micromonospora purpureochromogenes]